MLRKDNFIACNTHYIQYPFDDFLRAQKDSGYSGLELCGAAPHIWIDHRKSDDAKTLRGRIESFGLKTEVFAPEYTSFRYMLNASEPARHARSLEYYKRCCDFAAALGAKVLVVNGFGADRDEKREAASSRLIETLGSLCGAASSAGIRLALESLCADDSTVCTSLTEVKEIISKVNNPVLQAALDTVAAGANGETITDWFDALGDKIIYVRLSDGRRGYDHYAWGDGIFPAEKFFAELNATPYEGPVGQMLSLRAYIENPVPAEKRNRAALEKTLAAVSGVR